MIYLDNAATSYPKPSSVYEAMDHFARHHLANPGRAGHKMALTAEHTLDNARHRLNRFFNGRSPERWIFTLNGTDALNIAIKGVLRDGDHVVTTNVEHNSVSRPLVALAEAGRITLTRVSADGVGWVDPAAIEAAMTSRTRLVVVTHASNVVGTIQPITEIGRLVRSRDALFLVDAAQTAGVVSIDVQAMCIDLLAFPGHKGLLGPTGTGALYVGPRAEAIIRPWREGGTGGDSSSPTQPRELPYYLEGGTPNVLGIAGLIAGLDFVESQGPERLRQHEIALCEKVRHTLSALPGFDVFGPADPAQRVGTLSFRHHSLPAGDLAAILDQSFDIAVRPGLHCAPYIHRHLGTYPEGTVRISPGPFTSENEIDRLLAALQEITTGL
ncbi:MAG: aminotransferase class V-fold PLP-dependent enzyme [Gemmataceae bacterium]|nr:aminotransferase class V-fold PLP-dependent enzyme [Gemmataceae bacterium]MCS7270266.1 aminotransferase class V-fold PLP-dependent enzyme [Gemmataceae bacterium]MDW8244558.1 aminotransferase class V-fold PLP-dependent enzyme [Thermogemmata sp.]